MRVSSPTQRASDPSSQFPVARLEYIFAQGDQVQKGATMSSSSYDIFKIGRDPRSNNFSIHGDHESLISRNHCEIYTVVYEPGVNLVYVRDRKSFNGTFVNGILIGKGRDISSGYLLEDGDIVEILPYWKFMFRQDNGPPRVKMNKIQVAESRFFSDKYLISERCIGQGTDANVYLAQDVISKRQIVCKVVNLDELQNRFDRHGSTRKLQEADILRQLRHPNILPYIESISSPHSLQVFSLASGGDLMSFINRHNGVKEFDTRIIIRQVIRGLNYLHTKGIIHRDLKPENILLAYSPKIAYHRVMLSDFATSAVPRRSRMKTLVGTANYQAPELYDSQSAQTPAIDIWSLGIVAIIMLTAGLGIENIIPKFNRYTQTVLDRTLKQDIFQPCLKLSKNSKTFIWQCLQISPKARISGLEALDHKILGSWKAPVKLNPMPLQLPSVLMGALAQARGQEELFKAYSDLSRHYPLLQTEFSKYFGKATLKNNSKEVVGERKLSTKAEFGQPRESEATAASSDVPESSGTGSALSSRETTDTHKKSIFVISPKRKNDEALHRDMKRQTVPGRKTGS
ncbi:Protein kinase-like domain protein [Metarhizium guizhouense ARSEF 977]|uniref:non-specific serine/threonine protein kinase n=1 Tax=Metarhizium guizhouense (strain ARSEF 977) TaxID=1276136 RepID=A0A0B4GPQ2_METGA|nr:Protein kinase-like domain protein [Metarhizium guizhouense ARSEF 977]